MSFLRKDQVEQRGGVRKKKERERDSVERTWMNKPECGIPIYNSYKMTSSFISIELLKGKKKEEEKEGRFFGPHGVFLNVTFVLLSCLLTWRLSTWQWDKPLAPIVCYPVAIQRDRVLRGELEDGYSILFYIKLPLNISFN